MRMILCALALAAAAVAAAPQLAAQEKRSVVDQLDRRVSIPAKVGRAVTLQHQTLNVIVQLGGEGQLVGVLRDWQKWLPASLGTIAPRLKTLAQPGELTKVNVEELLRLKPDVVFVTHYAPAAMIEQIERVGFPVVAVSFFTVPASERGKLNPVLPDEDRAYTDGLKAGIELIGEVLGRKDQARTMVDYIFARRRVVEERVGRLPREQRVRLYMANPNLETYGAGKYTGIIMERAGGLNVAAATIKGYKKVSMEDVLRWNPQVIFVQDRYAPVLDEIKNGAAWQKVDAVRNARVYMTPEYVKPWGHPMPESVSLGELWMAKKLYPEKFADIDMQAAADEYYRLFFRTAYAGPN